MWKISLARQSNHFDRCAFSFLLVVFFYVGDLVLDVFLETSWMLTDHWPECVLLTTADILLLICISSLMQPMSKEVWPLALLLSRVECGHHHHHHHPRISSRCKSWTKLHGHPWFISSSPGWAQRLFRFASAFITTLIKSKRVFHFWVLCLGELNMCLLFRLNAGATSNAVICRCDAIHSAVVGRVHRSAVEVVHRLRHIHLPHVTMYQLFHLIDSVGVLPAACVVDIWWIEMGWMSDWHSAEAVGLDRLTEWVPNVRPNFGQMLCARMKLRLLLVSALSGQKMS